MKIFWNTETRKLQRGFTDKSPVSLNELLRAERESTIPISLYLVPMATPGTTDYTFSLRRDGANIDTGTAKISWSTGQTAAIDLTAPKLAQRIEAALNSVSEIDAAGGADCTQMIAGRAYQIEFRSNGVRTLSTVALDTAQPDGSKIVEIDPGTATTKARHLLLLDEGELATVVAATDWSATSAPSVALTVVNAGSGTVRTVTKVKITGDPAPGSYLILNASDPIPVDSTGAEFAAKLSISTEVEKIGEYEWQITNTSADNTAVVEGTHSLDRWPGLTATLDLDTAEMAACQPAQLLARLIQGTDTLVSEAVNLSTGTIANISGTSLAVYPRATITTTAPTVTDDADSGHGLLSKWLNTTSGLVYTLTDNTAGAAVWVEGAGTSYLPLAGGTMMGALTLGGDLDVGGNDFRDAGDGIYTFHLGGETSAHKLIIRDSLGSAIFVVTGAGDVSLTGVLDGRDVAADGTKLDAITGTNTGNETTESIRTVGALMDDEVTNLAQVKAFNPSDYATPAETIQIDADVAVTAGQSRQAAANAGLVVDYGGSAMHPVAAVLSPNGSGTWSVLDDASHTPIGVASVTQDTDEIVVTQSFTASDIGAVTVTPDETLSKYFSCGASVGALTSRIKIYRTHPVGGYVYYTGSAWAKLGDFGIASMVWTGGNRVRVTWTTGYVTSNDNAFQAQVSGFDGGCIPWIDTVGTSYIDVAFNDFTGTRITSESSIMEFTLSVPGGGDPVNPNIITSSAFPSGNLWVHGTQYAVAP